MEEEEGGLRLSKRFSDQGGEVDLKTKAGTAWSHNFLNQKPWHPLSYPNQRRKWIAEQTHAQRQRRSEEVAREFAQEQEFFRQTALVSQKEKEKMEMMKAVSFMYVRPPGFNAESAKAAEIAEERRKEEESNSQLDPDDASNTMPLDNKEQSNDGKKKPRPKDVFGRALPTEEQFEVLKNAPKMETGIAGRAKPFGIELRNVKCLRCGNFGHQSGDRECPLKDAIMPNEESRLKRDDPLTAMMAHAESSEPLKWELKQRPGMSPPRGGFNPDDPNQQIVAEDIFDEYGGFLGAEIIPDLLANFSSEKPKKKKSKGEKHKRRSSPKSKDDNDSSSEDDERKTSKKRKHKRKKVKHSTSSESDDAEFGRHDHKDDKKRSKGRKQKGKKQKYSDSSSDDDSETERRKGSKHKVSYDDSETKDLHKQSKHKTSAYIDSGSNERRYDDSRSAERHGRNKSKTSAYDDSIINDRYDQSKSKSSAYDDSGSHGHDSRSNDHHRSSEMKSKRTSAYDDDTVYEERRYDDLKSHDLGSRERPKQSKCKTSAYEDPGSEDRRHDDSRSRESYKQSKSRTSAYDSSRTDGHRKQSKHKASAYDDPGSDDGRRSKHHHRSRHERD